MGAQEHVGGSQIFSLPQPGVVKALGYLFPLNKAPQRFLMLAGSLAHLEVCMVRVGPSLMTQTLSIYLFVIYVF